MGLPLVLAPLCCVLCPMCSKTLIPHGHGAILAGSIKTCLPMKPRTGGPGGEGPLKGTRGGHRCPDQGSPFFRAKGQENYRAELKNRSQLTTSGKLGALNFANGRKGQVLHLVACPVNTFHGQGGNFRRSPVSSNCQHDCFDNELRTIAPKQNSAKCHTQVVNAWALPVPKHPWQLP